MSEHVTMPALGESVTEGTVTRWLKQVGEEVAVDEPLLEVSTDKVDTEIPSPIAGTVQEILVQEDETVPVGSDLVVIGDGAPSSADSGGSDSAKSAAPETSSQDASGDQSDSQSNDEKPASSDDSDSPAQSSGGGAVSGGEKITMPALGESVTEGTITRWLKSEGDDVEMDEPLLEVSTDKVDTEVPSPVAGKLTKILVQEDETVPVGADLAVIGGEVSGGASAPAPQEKKEEPKQEEPKQEAPKQEEPKQEAPKQETPKQEAPKQEAAQSDAAAYVTPLVRKLASDNGVDLAALTGTGVGGRIRKQDVLDAAAKAKEPEPAQPAPAATSSSAAPATVPQVSAKRGTTEKMTRMRRLIATRMVESLQISAQLTTVVEVDVTKIARLRTRAKAGFEQREGVKLSFLPFFALATVEALKAHPMVNASVEGDSIVYHASENLGIAVDTEKGLFVPVVQNAGDLNIAGLARKIADLAARTRDNKVTPDELGGGTFTLTNTGSRGALFDTPIINQPQVGILGTGTVVKRPVVVIGPDGDETIAVRSMCYLALSYDHRIVDGADAARFLGTMKARLEEGAFEV
ncbi:2-oxoglutarate dehydrogenase, E2 component, dihydrolipoamide succinyltransferase [Leekyejoonella antrihumi]|uniref:Dihydrolipoamide acetyltransferase component of pyruvate dehydrogenase complex n=1 Tax=Leekyejoonella antrihumi TaxID=1660198 RepID=A0A563E583_9MICO|nr:2-oxoglutarate dehydrogenase, E2 component, dihydrolipoamide succinyltransferase [Leekyejoonella antrihumi]TWP37034.1 2-oxoglutarate dehydrogenase, E2 component, dihydrolipoamide succinyltransferase [Leekyejoonella antrihumi]